MSKSKEASATPWMYNAAKEIFSFKLMGEERNLKLREHKIAEMIAKAYLEAGSGEAATPTCPVCKSTDPEDRGTLNSEPLARCDHPFHSGATLDPSTVITDDFDDWWAKDGRYYDPDTSDVPWYDKRKELAEYAYERGKLVTTRWTKSYEGEAATGPTPDAPTKDAFEVAWKQYNPNGNAGDWERVAFISGFGKGFKAGVGARASSGATAPHMPSVEDLLGVIALRLGCTTDPVALCDAIDKLKAEPSDVNRKLVEALQIARWHIYGWNHGQILPTELRNKSATEAIDEALAVVAPEERKK